MSNPKQLNNDSDLDYQQLISRVEDKTKNKVDEIFTNSDLNSWLKENQGSTYARILAEFKPIAERRFRSEYLQQALEDRVGILLSAKTRLKERIGNLTAVLKPWEGGKLSWLLSPISLCIEWLLKAGLGVIPIISIILILDNRPLSQILGKPNEFTYLGIFAGVALVWLISASAYNWVVSVSSSGVIQNYYSNFELTRKREKLKNGERKYSRQSYFWGISQFSILLIIICIIEAYIGLSVISSIFENAYKIQESSAMISGLKEGDPGFPDKVDIDPFSLFLSASVFALTNLLFSVSKANRYNQIQKTKRSLKALLNQLNHLDREIEHCKREVKKVKKDFEKDKLEYDELFNKEESGILNEIRLLSNQAYVNPPESMKSSQESDRTKKETFDRNSFPQDVSSSEAQSNNPIS